jgi:hypothetical protein
MAVRWPLTQNTQRLLHMCPSWISICCEGSKRWRGSGGEYSKIACADALRPAASLP